MSPSILLADEPTGNLDKKTGSGIHQLFLDLNNQLKLTVVIVTHDEALARRMPRRLVMENGILFEADDAPSKNMESQLACEKFVGEP
jgi:lipoprotein-releasing system ATP-binding protein